MKKHIRDIRAYNNGGASIPVCNTNPGDRLYHFTSVLPGRDLADCKVCPVVFKKRYPWASGR